MEAFDRQPTLANLLLDADFQSRITAAAPAWRKIVGTAATRGIPAPAFSASLAYFDAFTAAQLPQNLTQAQRDFFGAHTYQRADRPDAGFVHSDWNALIPRSSK
jgi:6-phosphogluconate dehydrogenase